MPFSVDAKASAGEGESGQTTESAPDIPGAEGEAAATGVAGVTEAPEVPRVAGADRSGAPVEAAPPTALPQDNVFAALAGTDPFSTSARLVLQSASRGNATETASDSQAAEAATRPAPQDDAADLFDATTIEDSADDLAELQDSTDWELTELADLVFSREERWLEG
jgi:hypothetical protein